ncbi:spore gernimation protein KB, partial [Priestia megaterium]
RLSYPLGLIVLFLSITIASNLQEHNHEGLKVAMFVIHIPLLGIIPPFLLLVAFFKDRKKHGKNTFN